MNSSSGSATTARQQATKTRLLAAARSVFAEQGIDGTSVAEIADRAGFTRGAFYSNFDSKHAIVLAVLQRVGEAQLLAIPSPQVNGTDGSPTSRSWRTRLRATFDGVGADRELTLLDAELQLHAARNESLAAPYSRAMQTVEREAECAIVEFASASRLSLLIAPSLAAKAATTWWLTTSLRWLTTGQRADGAQDLSELVASLFTLRPTSDEVSDRADV